MCADASLAVQHVTLCSAACEGSQFILTRCPDSATPSSTHAGWFKTALMQCNSGLSCSAIAASAPAGGDFEQVVGRWELDRVLETGMIGSDTVHGAILDKQSSSSALGTLSSADSSVSIGCGAGCASQQPLEPACRWGYRQSSPG